MKLGASHGESIFMESKIYPQTQEIMTADIEVLFEFIAVSVLDFCKERFSIFSLAQPKDGLEFHLFVGNTL